MRHQATYGALSRGHNHELPPVVFTDMQAIAVHAAVKLHRDSLLKSLHKGRERSQEDAGVLRGAIEVLGDVERLLYSSRRAGSCRPPLTEVGESHREGNGRPQGGPANDS